MGHNIFSVTSKFIVRVGGNGAGLSTDPHIREGMSDEEITNYMREKLNDINAQISKQQDEGDGFVDQNLYILRREYSCLLNRRR